MQRGQKSGTLILVGSPIEQDDRSFADDRRVRVGHRRCERVAGILRNSRTCSGCAANNTSPKPGIGIGNALPPSLFGGSRPRRRTRPRPCARPEPLPRRSCLIAHPGTVPSASSTAWVDCGCRGDPHPRHVGTHSRSGSTRTLRSTAARPAGRRSSRGCLWSVPIPGSRSAGSPFGGDQPDSVSQFASAQKEATTAARLTMWCRTATASTIGCGPSGDRSRTRSACQRGRRPSRMCGPQ